MKQFGLALITAGSMMLVGIWLVMLTDHRSQNLTNQHSVVALAPKTNSSSSITSIVDWCDQ
ncbi:hypothetical protein N692_12665 [Lactiplantibacillus plantarum EGD-AQ4]|nr:hypothetical protein [Lactiplantibacillus pentosus]EIW13728.1 hypothetical protein KCA1_1657 [Lactiplantibacillus pentosus KCA1]EQM54501.1 hypothetical protein N692_12665 [Lactiplantibacillus plantarum EGD-AQ4]